MRIRYRLEIKQWKKQRGGDNSYHVFAWPEKWNGCTIGAPELRGKGTKKECQVIVKELIKKSNYYEKTTEQVINEYKK